MYFNIKKCILHLWSDLPALIEKTIFSKKAIFSIIIFSICFISCKLLIIILFIWDNKAANSCPHNLGEDFIPASGYDVNSSWMEISRF